MKPTMSTHQSSDLNLLEGQKYVGSIEKVWPLSSELDPRKLFQNCGSIQNMSKKFAEILAWWWIDCKIGLRYGTMNLYWAFD
jgi:hypothetical protein